MPDTPPAVRHDGWTADRQRLFLERIADGATVETAAGSVGLSATAAYAFRRRPAGAAFALGWRAANLLAREHVADALLARALDGQVERIVRPDGSVVERHRFDNRLAASMLARLDRQAEGETPGEGAAARLVAGDFDAYLDLVGQEGGPARAGLFVAAHGDPAAALEPLAALARADARLRGADGEDDVADLDPAARAGWTADQWRRAEAAGVVALAPEPADRDDADDTDASPQLPQLHEPVWYCDRLDQWRTDFPPPDGFYGAQDGVYGGSCYSRALSPEEAEVVEGEARLATVVRAIEQGRVRDAWFEARRPRPSPEALDDDDDFDAPAPAEPSAADPPAPAFDAPAPISGVRPDIPRGTPRISDPLGPPTVY